MSAQNWTTANIPDLTGKVIIVTGANSGIGLESAREFARKGALIIEDSSLNAVGLLFAGSRRATMRFRRGVASPSLEISVKETF